MAGLDAGVKEELSKVITCGEFKETVLKIFEALLAPNYEDRKKPKLSFFDGKSFDKMCQKISKLFSSFKIEEYSQEITPEDREKLLKILKEYKGRKSPHKLLATKKVIDALNAENSDTKNAKNSDTKTYGGIIKLVNSELMSLYGLDDVVHSNKKCVPAEMGLWNKINDEVRGWEDDKLIDSSHSDVLRKYYEKFVSEISSDKGGVLRNIMIIIRHNAEMNSEEEERSKNDLSGVKKLIDEQSKLEQFRDWVNNNWNESWSVDSFKNNKISGVLMLDLHSRFERIASGNVKRVWMNIIKDYDNAFYIENDKLKVKNGAKVADWREVLKTILKIRFEGDLKRSANELKKSYCEIENAKSPYDVFENFEHSLKIYSAHQSNAVASEIFEQLKEGLALYTGAEGVYKALFPRSTSDYTFSRENLKQRYKEIINSCNSGGKCDISKIDAFVGKLKKGNFNF